MLYYLQPIEVHFVNSNRSLRLAKAVAVKGAGAEDDLRQKIDLAVRNNIFTVVTILVESYLT